MSEPRRISAGELENRYKTRHELFDFYTSMENQIMRQFEVKQTSWKSCSKKYLLKKLKKNLKQGNWVDVANYAFFLANRKKRG